LLLILHKKIQFYIFIFKAWNVAKGRKVQGGRILSQGIVYCIYFATMAFFAFTSLLTSFAHIVYRLVYRLVYTVLLTVC
jgi:hypothetical protein